MVTCEGRGHVKKNVLACEPPLNASSICTNSALSFETYRLCVLVFHPGSGPVTAVFPPDDDRSFRLLGLHIQSQSATRIQVIRPRERKGDVPCLP